MNARIGHNMPDAPIRVTVRLFNSVAQACGRGGAVELELPVGSTVEDVVKRLSIPLDKVFLILRNGRDVTPTLKGPLNVDAFLEDGDVIAFSGPVPYSAGYGAPVV
ncbi:MoaD/ThiS family protein [Thermopetrobacter sp. TC1]|uniref:MoaD/ThiS family protein n=1 Tax=Thermopetrobacter sp. TC1 TaxID=1495045 RepID=UPI0012E045F3|nr:MoaD/ThiS family protein [Thermopetrobacter sp. TC1]